MTLASLRSFALPACVALALSAVPVGAVTITDDFNSYTASDTPVTGLGSSPGFGTASGGWLQGWRTAATPSTTASVKVLDTSPVKSGGNYFSATITTNALTGTSPAEDALALNKAYDVAGNSLASVTALYYNFDFRVDSYSASTMRFDISDNTTRSSGGNSGSSWEFRSINGFWNVNSSGNFSATTMAVTAGTTYSFAIVINPVTLKWDYVISDGSTSVTGSALNFRGTAFATDSASGSVGGRWLTFGVQEAVDTSSQTAAFSIDNISISTTNPIPEPSTFAFLGGIAALVFTTTRRRR
jgi:hypothetical protein